MKINGLYLFSHSDSLFVLSLTISNSSLHWNREEGVIVTLLYFICAEHYPHQTSKEAVGFCLSFLSYTYFFLFLEFRKAFMKSERKNRVHISTIRIRVSNSLEMNVLYWKWLKEVFSQIIKRKRRIRSKRSFFSMFYFIENYAMPKPHLLVNSVFCGFRYKC